MLGLRKSQITKLLRKNKNIFLFLRKLDIIETYGSRDNKQITENIHRQLEEIGNNVAPEEKIHYSDSDFDYIMECFCKATKIPPRMMEVDAEETADEKPTTLRKIFVDTYLNSTRRGRSKKIYNKLNRKIS